MDSIVQLYERNQKRAGVWLKKISSEENGAYHFSGHLHEYHKISGILNIKNGDIEGAKRDFSVCGLIDEYGIKCHNSRFRFFDYGLSDMNYVQLSDNEKLINRYSQLSYPAHGQIPCMEDLVLEGESVIWAKALLVLLANEGNKPKEILDKLEETVLRKLDKKDSLWLDFKFFQALSNRSKNDCEAILEELTSIKIHKTRNDNGVISQYVSQPALGYAKLAWRHGLEVETNSPLIPKELLPIQPLEEYPIPYDFLKEH